MSIAGTFPETGVRVALDLSSVDDAIARYQGNAFTPSARHALDLKVDVKTGSATLQVPESVSREDGPSRVDPPPLEAGDLAFVRQLGKQLWRLATQDPELRTWPRRIQRWRGPK